MNIYNPVSTYRFQFNKDFTFQQAEQLVDYLSQLGICTVYASPVFAAVPGSTHGYDVINPFVVNPEIGSEQQLRRLIGKLKERGIGWIQDIVPNHMAYHTSNPWIADVMEKGAMSPYAQVFDTAFASDFLSGKPMVPFLGDDLEHVAMNGELTIVHHHHKLCLHYGEAYFPVNSRSYEEILSVSNAPASIKEFVSQLADLHRIDDSVQYALRWHELLLQFAAFMQDVSLASVINGILSDIVADGSRILQIAKEQAYRLCHWRETDDRINYRRFFLVNGLICLNMHSRKVFSLYHEKIAAFIREGLFTGVRVDHIDGLFDPVTYLRRLRELCGLSCYIIVEKILEHGEELDVRWPIQGTTGYEFLAAVNNLFTRSSSENRLTKFYRSLNPDRNPISEGIREKKRYILDHHMQGELSNLTTYFAAHLQPNNIDDNEVNVPFEITDIREAIALLLIELPVYRYYGNSIPLESDERDRLERLFDRCISVRRDLSPLLLYMVRGFTNEHASGQWLEFYQRIMQFTGPLMAKGVEDTLMYTFNRFVAHNEVGDSPEFFGLSIHEFHQLMKDRQRLWPMALNATSTHDTKRGEDVRMRLNVLPDIAETWIEQVKTWMNDNRHLKTDNSPDVNDEYFIYQNLVGIYTASGEADISDRMKEFMTKAMREAKRHSDWASPNEAYEGAVIRFLEAILSSTSFINSLKVFCRSVTDFGMINSFSQLTLKVTCPGVPDIYQGTTDWDLSLVDPDNRRPVDFDKQRQHLSNTLDFRSAWPGRDDGSIKAALLQRLLAIRNEYKTLFLEGNYIPLEVEGRRSDNCLAFARQLGSEWILVGVPLNPARFVPSADRWNDNWGDTEIILPANAPGDGRNLLSNTVFQNTRKVRLSDAFSDSPVAVLLMTDNASYRSAGVVLHVSSLPGQYGVGDMGPAARNFADFLHASRQRVWQLLPINPPQRSAAYSPYSSYSAMAGSILYISPDDLIADGLLDRSFHPGHVHMRTVDFDGALTMKSSMLRTAYYNFLTHPFHEIRREYEEFLEGEASWLRDYALFEILRAHHDGRPWYEWPEALRDRTPDALMAVEQECSEDMGLIMWSQYIFRRQWTKLRKYCHGRGIRLMGDLPFYLDRDSADVWSRRELFSVDQQGKQLSVAGVPPYYFSADGQLWGMPVYNWEAMRRDKYSWFVNRIRYNLSLFDMLRLDHFRAFASYWEVPAGEATARGGSWKEGPRGALFEAVKMACGSCELIAEDLGEITPDVYELRNALQMPGMFVLQFAFGNDIASSVHSPHNHSVNGVVYTGTHDNNTARGWFRKELDRESKSRLSKYSGKRVTANNVSDTLIEMAYRSVARTAMVPMQDILGLNERNRLNTPATVNKQNWKWRLTEIPGDEVSESLAELTRLFGR